MREQREVSLRKNNSNRDWSDMQWVEEFYEFLQGEIPENIHLADESKLHLTSKQARTIVWYLQEHFCVFPDNIEMCDECCGLYDSDCAGVYYEIEGKQYCEACEHCSDATFCDCCGEDVWKRDAYDSERGEYLCEECKVKKMD